MLQNPQGYGGYMPYPDQQLGFDPSMYPQGMAYQGASPAGLPPRPMEGAGAGGIHPSRLAAMGPPGASSPMGMIPMGSPMGMPPQLAGQIRPFEDGQMGQGAPKRPRIAKLPGGQFYPVRIVDISMRTIANRIIYRKPIGSACIRTPSPSPCNCLRCLTSPNGSSTAPSSKSRICRFTFWFPPCVIVSSRSLMHRCL